MAQNQANAVANIDAGEIMEYGILLDYFEDPSDQVIVIREIMAGIEIYLNCSIEQYTFCPFCPFCHSVEQTHPNRKRYIYEQEEEQEEVPYYIWDNPIQSNLI